MKESNLLALHSCAIDATLHILGKPIFPQEVDKYPNYNKRGLCFLDDYYLGVRGLQSRKFIVDFRLIEESDFSNIAELKQNLIDDPEFPNSIAGPMTINENNELYVGDIIDLGEVFSRQEESTPKYEAQMGSYELLMRQKLASYDDVAMFPDEVEMILNYLNGLIENDPDEPPYEYKDVRRIWNGISAKKAPLFVDLTLIPVRELPPVQILR